MSEPLVIFTVPPVSVRTADTWAPLTVPIEIGGPGRSEELARSAGGLFRVLNVMFVSVEWYSGFPDGAPAGRSWVVPPSCANDPWRLSARSVPPGLIGRLTPPRGWLASAAIG